MEWGTPEAAPPRQKSADQDRQGPKKGRASLRTRQGHVGIRCEMQQSKHGKKGWAHCCSAAKKTKGDQPVARKLSPKGLNFKKASFKKAQHLVRIEYNKTSLSFIPSSSLTEALPHNCLTDAPSLTLPVVQLDPPSQRAGKHSVCLAYAPPRSTALSATRTPHSLWGVSVLRADGHLPSEQGLLAPPS